MKAISAITFKITLLVLLVAPIFLLNGNSAQAYDFKEESGLGNSADKAGFITTGDLSIELTVGKIVLIIISFLGVVFLGMIIYGGFTYMTAHGNEEKVKKAMGTIMSALLGFIVTLAAYVLTYFVFNSLK
jgi:hypothetical protein